VNSEKELVYQCVRCKAVWTYNENSLVTRDNLEFLVSVKKVGVSTGICPVCFRGQYVDSVRSSQRKEGYPDCFLRYNDSCSSSDCKFKNACQDHRVKSWQSKVIANKELGAYL
jgi:hypothetical protein